VVLLGRDVSWLSENRRKGKLETRSEHLLENFIQETNGLSHGIEGCGPVRSRCYLYDKCVKKSENVKAILERTTMIMDEWVTVVSGKSS